MAKKSDLVSPGMVADMRAELQSLVETEPGARELIEVVRELLPLIRGCRDRGHSWNKIAGTLQKSDSRLSIWRLRKLAFELDPTLKGVSGEMSAILVEVLTSQEPPLAEGLASQNQQTSSSKFLTKEVLSREFGDAKSFFLNACRQLIIALSPWAEAKRDTALGAAKRQSSARISWSVLRVLGCRKGSPNGVSLWN
jgi:hypothetical protein